jgi:DNA-binding XRE family transcriptional regulator
MGYTPYPWKEDAMANEFNKLIEDIEKEARVEGPAAEQELKDLRAEFRCANQFIEARRARGLTQKQLSQLSGVDQSEISRIETGLSNPTYSTMTALAEPLRCSVGLISAE